MVKKFKIIFQNKEINNATWIIGQQIFQMLLQLVVGVLTARYLGPRNFGALNYTASFVTFFTSIATLGMDGVVVKSLIDNPDKEDVIIGSTMGLRTISSILSMISVFVLVAVLNPQEKIKWILVFLQSFQLLFRAIQIMDSWFQRHLKSKYVSIGKMGSCIVVSLYKIVLLVTAKDIVWFAFSNSLTDAVIMIIEYWFYIKEGGKRPRFSLEVGIGILKNSYHFIISGIMVAIYSQMDRVMIGQMMSDLDVGLYTTATAICSMWTFVPNAIITSLEPNIMVLKKRGDEEAYLRKLKQLYSIIIWLCIGVSVVVAVGAKIFIYILYGKAYIGATNTLRIAIWFETFAMIGNARGVWILCENKNKYVKYYLGIGAVVNLVLNMILIPALGINGAAIATLVTQFVTSLIAPLLFRETREFPKIVLDAFGFRW